MYICVDDLPLLSPSGTIFKVDPVQFQEKPCNLKNKLHDPFCTVLANSNEFYSVQLVVLLGHEKEDLEPSSSSSTQWQVFDAEKDFLRIV